MHFNSADISSGSRRAQISPDLPKKAGIFPMKIVKN